MPESLGLEFEALTGAQHFALQVKRAALFTVVHVEQPLELFVDFGEIGLAGFGRRDVEDAAGFVECQAADERVLAAVGLPCICAAYFWEAEACLYASAKARPNTRAPVKTIVEMMRCAMAAREAR